MSSLRVYICYSQRSFIIDFNGARPVYPKLNRESGIYTRYRLLSQFKSIVAHKHRQCHSTTRLIGTSLVDYAAFLYHFTSVSASAESCVSYTSLIRLILGILFSAVTTTELTNSKLKAWFSCILPSPPQLLSFIHSFNWLIYTYFITLSKFVSMSSLWHIELNSVKSDCFLICGKAFHIIHAVFYTTVWRSCYEISS